MLERSRGTKPGHCRQWGCNECVRAWSVSRPNPQSAKQHWAGSTVTFHLLLLQWNQREVQIHSEWVRLEFLLGDGTGITSPHPVPVSVYKCVFHSVCCSYMREPSVKAADGEPNNLNEHLRWIFWINLARSSANDSTESVWKCLEGDWRPLCLPHPSIHPSIRLKDRCKSSSRI